MKDREDFLHSPQMLRASQDGIQILFYQLPLYYTLSNEDAPQAFQDRVKILRDRSTIRIIGYGDHVISRYEVSVYPPGVNWSNVENAAFTRTVYPGNPVPNDAETTDYLYHLRFENKYSDPPVLSSSGETGSK